MLQLETQCSPCIRNGWVLQLVKAPHLSVQAAAPSLHLLRCRRCHHELLHGRTNIRGAARPALVHAGRRVKGTQRRDRRLVQGCRAEGKVQEGYGASAPLTTASTDSQQQQQDA